MSGALIILPILIFSAILHEVAHGFVADKLGDPTARLLGRLTLNPIPHIDPFMSILLPAMLMLSGSPVIFGAAKPVPVNPLNLREGRKDLALVALAGPLTNVLIAVAASLVLRFIEASPFAISYTLLATVVRINLLLAIFNLLPIPPLDGSKIFSLILPERQANSYLSLGFMGMFLIFFVILFAGGFIFGLLNFAENLLGI